MLKECRLRINSGGRELSVLKCLHGLAGVDRTPVLSSGHRGPKGSASITVTLPQVSEALLVFSLDFSLSWLVS